MRAGRTSSIDNACSPSLAAQRADVAPTVRCEHDMSPMLYRARGIVVVSMTTLSVVLLGGTFKGDMPGSTERLPKNDGDMTFATTAVDHCRPSPSWQSTSNGD